MNNENVLVIGIIFVAIIVILFISYSFLVSPQKQQSESKIFSLKDCENSGFSRSECFNLSANEIKKIKGVNNG